MRNSVFTLRPPFQTFDQRGERPLGRYLDRLSLEDDSAWGLAEPDFDNPASIVAVKSALSSFLGLYNISSVLYCKRLLRVSTAVAQSHHHSPLQLVYSASGLISLKRVHDQYDTDYIAAGRTLSDLLIRYRSMGAKDWKKASAAMLDTRSQRRDSVFFTIGELLPTIANSRASSVHRLPSPDRKTFSWRRCANSYFPAKRRPSGVDSKAKRP